MRTRGLSRSPPLCVQFTRRGLLVCFFSPPRFADAVVRAPWPAVIDELKQEAAKRGGDAEAKADDGDKRKWMSTAQLWVDSDAKSDEVEHATLLRHACYFHQISVVVLVFIYP